MRAPVASRLRAPVRAACADPAAWLVVLFSLIAVLPLTQRGYFLDAHDAPQTVFFLNDFYAALRDGTWYPGWATSMAWGYGYPIFVFYSPLPYYVASLFRLLGAGTVVALKWTWVLATVGSGLGMYALARHLLGKGRALLAATVYVFVPYHLVDLYVRAALAEYCAFAWMPLVLLAFCRLAERASARRIGAAGLAYGALWLTHNVTAIAFTPLLAALVAWRLVAQAAEPPPRRPGRGRRLVAGAGAALAGALLGCGVAAALLLPGLLESADIRSEQVTQANYAYSGHFVAPFQLVLPFWGYGHSVPGPEDSMPLQLGTVALLLSAVSLAAALRRRARERGLTLFLAAASTAIILLMFPSSQPIWDALPIAGLIQFPWRLLALTAVTLSLLAGLAVRRVGRRRAEGGVLVLALAAMVGSFGYLAPRNRPVPSSVDEAAFTVEFETAYPDMIGMTAWTQELPSTSPLVEQIRAGSPLVTAEARAPGATVRMIRTAGATEELWVTAPSGTPLRFFTYYYPGWQVSVDGKRLPNSALRPEGPYGLLEVDVPAGEHHVLLRWGDTPVRAAGKTLTLGCLVLALGLVLARPSHPASEGRLAKGSGSGIMQRQEDGDPEQNG